MIRLLVTGRNGQLATCLGLLGRDAPGIAVMAVGRPEFDLEHPASVAAAIAAARPDIVVNAAAYTAVDRAEQDEAKAFAVNRDGAEACAIAAARLGLALIHLSTDYVYPGDKPSPYIEGDATGPLGVYGRSKLAGEAAVRAAHPRALILRTSWVYSPYGTNFVKTMLRAGRERDEVGVVDDQTGNPTSALDLADAILRIAPRLVAPGGEAGILNLCGTGDVTWCGFARHIFAVSGNLGGPRPKVRPIVTAEFPTPAKRPANSRLSTAAFAARFGFTLRPWQEATADTVARLLA
jgi:dTDP-4-dehydrorhamnose reductase